MSVPSVRPASTVVLLRQGHDGVEVFLVRRHGDIAFMGGAHVFPGGRVEPADAADDNVAFIDGVEAAAGRMPQDDRRAALAFHVAAIRETFEEAGILLVRDGTGVIPSLHQMDVETLAGERRALRANTQGLLDVVRPRRWRFAADLLVYFAHWITPEVETRRFDARFFLAAAPPEQIASHDAEETTEGVWLTPSEAIERCRRGEIALPPPTWTTLRWLEPFATVDAALEWARPRPVVKVQPRLIENAETRMVILPGDPAMPAVAGFEARETRFILSAGRWMPVSNVR